MSRPTSGHTATYKGKRVRVALIDGSELEGRFLDRTPNGYIVLDVGKVHKRLVARFLVLRGGRSRPGEMIR